MLPKPPKEVPQNKNIDACTPRFAAKLRLLLAEMKTRGSNAIIGETFRTKERQKFLAGFGRIYDDGRGVVTKAQTPEGSWHAYGCAADIWDGNNPNKPWEPANPTKFYADLVASCKKVGIRCGYDWDGDGDLQDQTFQDKPHVQAIELPVSPTTQDRADYLAGRTRMVLRRYKLVD
jgi:hypothetical protein